MFLDQLKRVVVSEIALGVRTTIGLVSHGADDELPSQD